MPFAGACRCKTDQVRAGRRHEGASIAERVKIAADRKASEARGTAVGHEGRHLDELTTMSGRGRSCGSIMTGSM